jgi:hypothetical protein
MSPQLVMELTEIVAQRYLKAKRRKEKTKILDEYCENTGRNRKYAITKIREILFKPEKQKKKRGRKKKYDSSLDHYLIQIWEAYNGICPERLHPFLKEGIKKVGTIWILEYLRRGEGTYPFNEFIDLKTQNTRS